MHARHSFAFFVALFAPFVAYAAAPRTFAELVDYLIFLMNSAIGTIILAGLILYFYGIIRNVIKGEEGDYAHKSKYLLMGLAVLFVMVSVWGILNLLQNTLFSNALNAANYGGGGGGAGLCDSFFGCE